MPRPVPGWRTIWMLTLPPLLPSGAAADARAAALGARVACCCFGSAAEAEAETEAEGGACSPLPVGAFDRSSITFCSASSAEGQSARVRRRRRLAAGQNEARVHRARRERALEETMRFPFRWCGVSRRRSRESSASWFAVDSEKPTCFSISSNSSYSEKRFVHIFRFYPINTRTVSVRV